MGQLYKSLLNQLKIEKYKEDAERCIEIYNKLFSLKGHVWNSEWRVLVDTHFEGIYPNCKRISKPSSIGHCFLKG